MKFIVEFTGRDGGRYGDFPVCTDVTGMPVQTGLEQLDYARRELAMPKLDKDLICGAFCGLKCNPRLEITEEMARASGHFWQKNEIIVTARQYALNNFILPEMRVVRSESDDAILRVNFGFVVDENALRAAWEGLGFPLTWDSEHTEEEDNDD